MFYVCSGGTCINSLSPVFWAGLIAHESITSLGVHVPPGWGSSLQRRGCCAVFSLHEHMRGEKKAQMTIFCFLWLLEARRSSFASAAVSLQAPGRLSPVMGSCDSACWGTKLHPLLSFHIQLWEVSLYSQPLSCSQVLPRGQLKGESCKLQRAGGSGARPAHRATSLNVFYFGMQAAGEICHARTHRYLHTDTPACPSVPG